MTDEQGGTTPIPELAATVGERAAERGLDVAVAESLTSGAIAAALGEAPDASSWFRGGVVAYASEVKFDLLGVAPGPVITEACARQMGEGVARLCGASLVVAVTGAGGPGSEEGHPAGTVFVAHGMPSALRVDRLSIEGEPARVVEETVRSALALLVDDLRRSEAA